MYMSENGVDSPYLFLHPGFSIVANLAHPEIKKRKKSWTLDSLYLFLHCVFSIVASPGHLGEKKNS